MISYRQLIPESCNFFLNSFSHWWTGYDSSTFPAKATYAAIAETYAYLTPDLWKETVFTKSPYQVNICLPSLPVLWDGDDKR